MKTFLECIEFQAKFRPKHPAITTPGAFLSYESLVKQSHAALEYFVKNDLGEGDIVALNILNPIQHCCAVIGAMAGGMAALSAFGRDGSIPKNLSVSAIVSQQKDRTFENDARVVEVAPNWLRQGSPDRKFVSAHLAKRDGIRRIICTSGTTGSQKAVPFTETQLLERAWSQTDGLRPELGPSKTLGLMGVASGAGFTNMMLTLMTGGTLMLVPRMKDLANSSSLYQLDRILASTAQLIGILRRQDEEMLDLAGVKSIVVGGSHIPRSVAKNARSICRNIICLYGSTEAGVVATAPAEVTTKKQSAVGYVVPGVSVEIVNESGKLLNSNQEGIVRIKVPGAPSHYLNDDKASKEVFKDGWFYPGDIGRLDDDKLLYVSGRVSERINAGGVKVAPSVIEDVLGTRPEIADVAAFEYMNPDGIAEIAVAIVPHESIDRTNFDRAELRKHFQKQLREKTPKRWMIVREIPRNEQGKILREKLQDIAKKAIGRQHDNT
jgi:long-chain acyl-CoA synthetase